MNLKPGSKERNLDTMEKPCLLFAPETFNIAETTRMIEVAKQCGNTFRIVFFGYSDKFSYLIDEAGYAFHRMEPWLSQEEIDHIWKVDRLESWDNPFTTGQLRRRVASETALYAREKPVALVTGFTLSTTISTRAARVPLVYIMPFSYTRPFFESGRAEVPEMFDSPLARLVPMSWRKAILAYWGTHTGMWMKPFRRVARELGLEGYRTLMDIFEGDYNLVASAPELTGVASLPQHWHYVGPIFARLEMEIPGSFHAIPRDKPLIYFAMGSSANMDILKKVMASFEGMPYRIVSPMKSHLEKEQFMPPRNVYLYDWLPAHLVNPLVDMAIIHGGEGTVQTACASGKPFVGIGLQPEQESNIDYCVRYGNAIKILRRDISAAAIRNAIETALADDTMKRRALDIQTVLSRYDGPANAATFIKSTFGAPTRSLPDK